MAVTPATEIIYTKEVIDFSVFNYNSVTNFLNNFFFLNVVVTNYNKSDSKINKKSINY